MTQMDKARFDLPQQRKVTHQELAKLYETEAVYVNKFYVMVQPDGMVRLIFADTDADEQNVHPRFSVVMPAGSFLMFTALANGNVQNAKNVLQGIAGQVMRNTVPQQQVGQPYEANKPQEPQE